ncbi:biopolymer transporter ExbD [Leptolyngbya boryana CZ1]|uniref:Biopolymer transporter ExbD n=1 Tax=Leptolyngbya boryana CZ1 TaxID=3060204 RepID=A0AA97ARV8_LEPBY|nr:MULTISPECIES: biopolymer transporter ExbD [Leptolyngbya]MBD1859184.1 biopolymer transporter ExbD [Leptolyngbya sp. FACHB-1624]MBN8562888.1 biopolymer transporter ExbD [Leptolyngbya sp. UWPOB_LEPTO1]WNZ46929.1 biopolymer transporter ExbD [Leptolyngbya boryana CZ1]
MKFNKYQQSQIPEVNLVPMMDVIMTILTFFILVSMTLTSSKSVDATLPSTDKGVNNKPAPDPLIIGMTRAGQTEINNATVTETQIAEQVAAYFQRNPQGAIVLKADKSLAYEKVVQTLGTLRDVGGDRVSLAIE